MTTPTQAQIEAAINAMLNKWIEESPNRTMALPPAFWAEIGMPAALTAAAEVRTDFLCPKCGSRGYIKDGATTITAAAETGEQTASSIRAENERIARMKATTIERCAQVADKAAHRAMMEYATKKDYGYLWCSDEAKDIAAAIRALKGKP